MTEQISLTYLKRIINEISHKGKAAAAELENTQLITILVSNCKSADVIWNKRRQARMFYELLLLMGQVIFYNVLMIECINVLISKRKI